MSPIWKPRAIFGDALLVGINSDEATRQLKGPNRPVNSQDDRAAVLAALESVSAVCIFADKTATRFLERAQPDIYVKGGDYTLETLNQDERRAVETAGGTHQTRSVCARQIHHRHPRKNFAPLSSPVSLDENSRHLPCGHRRHAVCDAALHELRANFPEAEIDVLVRWRGAQICWRTIPI